MCRWFRCCGTKPQSGWEQTGRVPRLSSELSLKEEHMHSIVYLVGLIVIVLAILNLVGFA